MIKQNSFQIFLLSNCDFSFLYDYYLALSKTLKKPLPEETKKFHYFLDT